MVTRAAIANITPAAIAQAGQAAGLSGTLTPALGFGQWGTEPTTVVETTDPADRVEPWLSALLAAYGEQAAYITYDGLKPTLLYADGRRTAA